MENIEIIILALIGIGIIFKLLKIIKYFIGLVVLLFAFNILGGFDNKYVNNIDTKLGVSEKISYVNESLGLKGLISDLFK